MIRELCLDQVMHITDDTVVVTTLSGDESQRPSRNPFPQRHFRMDDARHRDAGAQRAVRSAAAALRLTTRQRPSSIPTNCIERLRSAGQQHGPAFQGIVGLTVSDSGAARAAVRLPSAAKQGARRFLLHPVMVDIALQALGATQVATDLAGGRDRRAGRGAPGPAWPASGSTAT